MIKHNAANERIKRAYFIYLREARRRNDASVDGVAKALARFEASTGHRDFGKFHRCRTTGPARTDDGNRLADLRHGRNQPRT